MRGNKGLEPMATTSTIAKIRLVQMQTTNELVADLKKRLLAAIEAAVNDLQ